MQHEHELQQLENDAYFAMTVTCLFNYAKLSAKQRARLWIRRLGYPGIDGLIKSTKDKTVKGLDVTDNLATDDDTNAQAARFKSKPHKHSTTDHSRLAPLHSMSIDHLSGFACKSLHGALSVYVAICLATNWIMCIPVKAKSDYHRVVQHLYKHVQAMGHKLCRLRGDSAPEIQAGKAASVCNEYDIITEPTGVYNPKSGAKHESAIQRLVHRARAMMITAPWLPPSLWVLALAYAAFVLNHTAGMLHGEFKSPAERMTGQKPDLVRKGIHVFGCKVVYGLTKFERMATTEKKMYDLTFEGCFVGYVGNLILIYAAGKVMTGIREKCHFYEGIFTQRNPPLQMNPAALCDEVDEDAKETISAQTDEHEDVEVVRSERNVVALREAVNKAAEKFQKVTINDQPIYDETKMALPYEGDKMTPTGVTAKEIMGTDVSTAEQHAAKTKEKDDIVSNGTEDERADQGESETPRVIPLRKSKKKQEEKRTERERRIASPAEKLAKVETYANKIMKHTDGTTGKITSARLQKVPRKDEYNWWLQVEWSDGQSFWRPEREAQQNLQDQSSAAADKHSDAQAQKPPQNKRKLRSRSSTRIAAFFGTICNIFAATAAEAIPTPEWKTPSNVFDCLISPAWRGWWLAMRSEYMSWKKLNVFHVVRKRDRDQACNIYPLKDVYKIKFKNGTFDKLKLRLCVLGNLMQRGIDCAKNVFAPTVSVIAARIFFAMAVLHGYPIWSLDVKTAYLTAVSSGKYYCFFPNIFKIAQMTEDEVAKMRHKLMHGTADEIKHLKRWLAAKFDPKDPRCLEILRSVYGDPASGRMFYLHFREVLKKLGWVATQTEQCLYVKQFKDGTYGWLISFVDDASVAAKPEHLREFFMELRKHVEITMERGISAFLGMNINYDLKRGVLTINVPAMIREAVRRFSKHLHGIRARRVPAPPGLHLKIATEEEHEQAKQLPFQELLGVLQWIVGWVRIEALCIINMLSTHNSKWNALHFKTALGVLRWLELTADRGIRYTRSDVPLHDCLLAYADADLASDLATRRSRTGKLIMCAGGPIAAKSRLQTTVQLSTTAAELIALTDTTGDVNRLRETLKEMGIEQTKPTLTLEDNQAAKCLADGNANLSDATKYLQVRDMKMREMVDKGIVRIEYCPTSRMAADIFTKNLNHILFERIANYITGNGTRDMTIELVAVASSR